MAKAADALKWVKKTPAPKDPLAQTRLELREACEATLAVLAEISTEDLKTLLGSEPGGFVCEVVQTELRWRGEDA